jgi:hypothetical protein
MIACALMNPIACAPKKKRIELHDCVCTHESNCVCTHESNCMIACALMNPIACAPKKKTGQMRSSPSRKCFTGVKQQLWGLRLRQDSTCKAGDVIMDAKAESDAKKIGTVTSVAAAKEVNFALGYLKCKRRGQQVDLEGSQAYINGDPVKVCMLSLTWNLMKLLRLTVF